MKDGRVERERGTESRNEDDKNEGREEKRMGKEREGR